MAKSTAQRNNEWDGIKRTYVQDATRKLGSPLALERRASSRWGRGPRGPFAILGADELLPGRWWLGLGEEQFLKGDVLGVILLCRKSDQLLDFALPAARLRPVLPHLSLEPRRGERKLNVQEVGSRYVLRVPGRQDLDLDLTESKGDLSWLQGPIPPTGTPAARDAPARFGSTQIPRTQVDLDQAAVRMPAPVSFFAKVRKRALEPLDDPGLEEGAVVLVTATRADSVPASPAMRRIVARGGPASLPADLAERHDVYTRQRGRS